VQVRFGYLASTQAAAAPGMLLKHYSPRAQLLLFDGTDWQAVTAHMQAEARRLLAAGRRVGIMASTEQAPLLGVPGLLVQTLGGQADLAAVGSRLFDLMRQLDQAGVEVILVAAPPAAGLGLAIRDRLYRAAAGRVIEVGDGERC
jgi:L-threonylcarbamoyladenylate synthase